MPKQPDETPIRPRRGSLDDPPEESAQRVDPPMPEAEPEAPAAPAQSPARTVQLGTSPPMVQLGAGPDTESVQITRVGGIVHDHLPIANGSTVDLPREFAEQLIRQGHARRRSVRLRDPEKLYGFRTLRLHATGNVNYTPGMIGITNGHRMDWLDKGDFPAAEEIPLSEAEAACNAIPAKPQSPPETLHQKLEKVRKAAPKPPSPAEHWQKVSGAAPRGQI
jgi:hypothetical protein